MRRQDLESKSGREGNVISGRSAALPMGQRINSSGPARRTSAHSQLGKACSGGNSRSESLALSRGRGERCFALATQLKAAARAEQAGDMGNN